MPIIKVGKKVYRYCDDSSRNPRWYDMMDVTFYYATNFNRQERTEFISSLAAMRLRGVEPAGMHFEHDARKVRVCDVVRWYDDEGAEEFRARLLDKYYSIKEEITRKVAEAEKRMRRIGEVMELLVGDNEEKWLGGED